MLHVQWQTLNRCSIFPFLGPDFSMNSLLDKSVPLSNLMSSGRRAENEKSAYLGSVAKHYASWL